MRVSTQGLSMLGLGAVRLILQFRTKMTEYSFFNLTTSKLNISRLSAISYTHDGYVFSSGYYAECLGQVVDKHWHLN